MKIWYFDTPGPKGVRILEAHHCAFCFPLLTSYTIMSEPRLLEYQLLSSFPFCGSLCKRFPILRKIRVCPTLSVLRQRFLLVFHSPLLSGTPALCLTRFSLPSLFVSYADFRVQGFNSIEPFTTAHSGDSNQFYFHIKSS